MPNWAKSILENLNQKRVGKLNRASLQKDNFYQIFPDSAAAAALQPLYLEISQKFSCGEILSHYKK